MSRKVFIRTFGWPMYEKDSEIIYSMMVQEGYSPISSYDEPNIIIFNTYSVRRHAEDRPGARWGNFNL